MQEKFELTDEYITLCNLLKVCGVTATGGAAKHLVADGYVEVDGQTELRKTCKIRAGQTVSGNGFMIAVLAPQSETLDLEAPAPFLDNN
jgi:ribosome-associated protein